MAPQNFVGGPARSREMLHPCAQKPVRAPCRLASMLGAPQTARCFEESLDVATQPTGGRSTGRMR